MNTARRFEYKWYERQNNINYYIIWDTALDCAIDDKPHTLHYYHQACEICEKMNEDFTIYTFQVNEYCLKPVRI